MVSEKMWRNYKGSCMKKKDFKKMLKDKQFAIIEDVNGNTLEKSMIKLVIKSLSPLLVDLY